MTEHESAARGRRVGVGVPMLSTASENSLDVRRDVSKCIGAPRTHSESASNYRYLLPLLLLLPSVKTATAIVVQSYHCRL